MIGFRRHIAQYACSLMLVLCILWGCQDTPYDPSMYYITDADLATGERTLIEHPYIFEELGLKLDQFKYTRIDSTIRIKAVLQGDLSPYQDCVFYVHAYPVYDQANFDKLSGPLKVESDQLIHEGTFLVDSSLVYQEIRFGLGCNKERPMSLSRKNIRFE